MLSQAPLLQEMNPSAPPSQPWEVGQQNVYRFNDGDIAGMRFPAQARSNDTEEWHVQRQKTLREWGKRRENNMHRRPKFLMDQMVSGSGLYPLRLLDDSWFTKQELRIVQQLEAVLRDTGHAGDLARDMLAPLVYDIEVMIILDNSGSMSGNMLDGRRTLDQVLQQVLPAPSGKRLSPALGAPSPYQSRMSFAVDALRKWQKVFQIIGVDPWVYLLTPTGSKFKLSNLPGRPQILGSTPMTEALQYALEDRSGLRTDSSSLILVLTDGEANSMMSFNKILDEVQNEVYGDVQVCIMGLSLVPKDIEWFENEECDETRIRTIEAFEVEQRQIQLKEVVNASDRMGYNFEMHSYRALVTNYFPADYDYEAHLQNLRHRIFITTHRCDRQIATCCRRCGNTSPTSDICCCWYYGWWGLSSVACSVCFLATGCHCAGWCQGERCGKCQKPDLIECCLCCCEEE